jgi:predicted PurR-regulated permease PerM
MKTEEIHATARSNFPQRILAVAAVVTFLYFASNIVITLLLAVLLAYFLDPVVQVLEKILIPRPLGAFLVLLAVTAIVGAAGYLVADRSEQFIDNWPRYSTILRRMTTTFDRQISLVEKQVDAIAPATEKGRAAVRPTEPPPIRDWLFRGVGSLYSILLVATFVPFLVFFMLAAKRSIVKASTNLFPDEHRSQVRSALDQVSAMLRGFVAGNALVALVLMLSSWAFFMAIHLDNPFLAGCVSGVLNLVPYLGAVLAWVPPFLIALAQWSTIGPYLGIASVLTLFHIIGLNVLMPAIVGRRVHLNALSVTMALLFWGWLWGAVGLILAIPITATIKVICDHVDGWEPAGKWMGA